MLPALQVVSQPRGLSLLSLLPGSVALLACLHKRGLSPHDAVAGAVVRSGWGLPQQLRVQDTSYLVLCNLSHIVEVLLGSVNLMASWKHHSGDSFWYAGSGTFGLLLEPLDVGTVRL